MILPFLFDKIKSYIFLHEPDIGVVLRAGTLVIVFSSVEGGVVYHVDDAVRERCHRIERRSEHRYSQRPLISADAILCAYRSLIPYPHAIWDRRTLRRLKGICWEYVVYRD